MSTSSRLIDLRKKLALSQMEMALELGVSRPTLSHWESGRRPIPDTALRLIEIYEEYIDEDLALRKHEEVIRKLANSWSERLILSFGRGARKQNRARIKQDLECSLFEFFRHELSPYSVKRNLQVNVFNRVVNVASRSKGLPMKFVQVMAFLNPSLDRSAREALEQIHQLQCPMAPTLVARIIHEDLGRSPSKLFLEWSPTPFATASIGQVHMARLRSGEKVAVKVQYPDIQRSLQSDLDSLGFFGEMISVFQPDVRSVVEKLKEAILNEADYERERDFMETFRAKFEGSPDIIIPKAYGAYCSRRILTMDYIDGQKIQEFKSASYEVRKRAAENLATFVTATAFDSGIMNTDTNSGNFIFCSDGKVAFLDFGRSVQIEIKDADQLLMAVINKDAELAKTLLPRLFPLKERAKEKWATYPFQQVWDFFLSQQAHLHAGEFHLTHDFIAKSMAEANLFALKKDLQTSMETIWSLATSIGLWNVLADLDVKVDYGSISKAVLTFAAEKKAAGLPAAPMS